MPGGEVGGLKKVYVYVSHTCLEKVKIEIDGENLDNVWKEYAPKKLAKD